MQLLDYEVLSIFQNRTYSDCAGIWRRVREYTYGDCKKSLKALHKKGYIEKHKKMFYKPKQFPPYWWIYRISEKGKEVEIKYTRRMWLWCENVIQGCKSITMSRDEIAIQFIALVDKFKEEKDLE